MYEEEIWKEIPHYEGRYLISNYGRVFSLLSNKMLALHLNNDGYACISLHTKNQKRKAERVHRLVALAFIPNPNGLPEVNHINCIRNDNRVENLEWVTRKQNIAYTSAVGHKSAKKVLCIETGEIFNTSTDAAKANGGDSGNIRTACRATAEGRDRMVFGYHYKYLEV